MDTDSTMIDQLPCNRYSSRDELLEQAFDIILDLSQPEKRELINLWKARKTNEQAAV